MSVLSYVDTESTAPVKMCHLCVRWRVQIVLGHTRPLLTGALRIMRRDTFVQVNLNPLIHQNDEL